MKKLFIATLVSSVGFAGVSFSATASDGPALLEKSCGSCHAATLVKEAKKNQEQWNATVVKMIGKGAQLTDAEKQILVNYLTATYKP